jgi:uncharacterized protein
MTLEHCIQQYQLSPHPEGGYYREVYRSSSKVNTCCSGVNFNGERNLSTAIYFLLHSQTFSGFHRIQSDELWHHYHGVNVDIHVLKKDGSYECKKLGLTGEQAQPMHLVQSGDWFASTCAEPGFALMGCTVAPGFDFADFEMGKERELLVTYPENLELVKSYCRE